MTLKPRATTIILSCSLIVAVMLAGMGWASWWTLRLQCAFAEDQTAIFEQFRTKAVNSKVDESISYWKAIVDCYPSGSKQTVGSALDRTVERARGLAIRDIIQSLRQKTEQDLGDNPHAWIEFFDQD